MKDLHHLLRKVLPFLYIRNWYTGQFEFSRTRTFVYATCVSIVIVLVLLVWWLGQPVVYVQPL